MKIQVDKSLKRGQRRFLDLLNAYNEKDYSREEALELVDKYITFKSLKGFKPKIVDVLELIKIILDQEFRNY